LYYMFFHNDKEITFFMAWLGLFVGSCFMDTVVAFKTPKDAL